MSTGFLVKRPWLLVWIAFFLLIGGWVVTFRLSLRAPSAHLTPTEETALLQGRAAR